MEHLTYFELVLTGISIIVFIAGFTAFVRDVFSEERTSKTTNI